MIRKSVTGAVKLGGLEAYAVVDNPPERRVSIMVFRGCRSREGIYWGYLRLKHIIRLRQQQIPYYFSRDALINRTCSPTAGSCASGPHGKSGHLGQVALVAGRPHSRKFPGLGR